MVPLATVNTRNILFICGGAFPELEEIIKERLRKTTSIGFNSTGFNTAGFAIAFLSSSIAFKRLASIKSSSWKAAS